MRPLKKLGQHFLNSPSVLNEIIKTSRLETGETVLEIGPGTGTLTTALLESGAKVTAIEKDPRSVELLREKFGEEINSGKLNLILGDILEVDDLTLPRDQFKIVANIPYYITGMILEKFLEVGPRPTMMVLLVQKEVADRILAKDGKMSVLSASIWAFGTPKYIKTVPPGAFNPPPSVDSAILAVDNITFDRFTENHISPADFFRIVKTGFAHKRKYAKSNLSEILPVEIVANSWKKLGLDDKIRAEKISISSWFDIVRTIGDQQ